MIGKLTITEADISDDIIVLRSSEKWKLSELIYNLKKGFEKGKKAVIEIKWFSKHRTISQNSYYWALVEELADRLRMSKDDVHVDLLQKYGQGDVDENGHKLIFSLRFDISPAGVLKYSKEIGMSDITVDGEKVTFRHYRALKGSKELNTLEMSILIDGLIADAHEYGIETDTPEELSLLKESWFKNEKQKS